MKARCGYCHAPLKVGAKKCPSCKKVFGKNKSVKEKAKVQKEKTVTKETSKPVEISEQKESFKFGEIFSTTFQVLKEKFWLLFALLFIFSIIPNVINTLFIFGDFKLFSWSYFIIIIASMLVNLIFTMTMTIVVDRTIKKEEIGFFESIKRSLPRFLPLVWTGLLLAISLMFLYVLLIIPGIIFSIYWLFAIQAVVLRDLKGKKAMDYSKSLVKGRWWEVFAILILFYLILLPVNFILGILTIFIRNVGFEVFKSVLLQMFTLFISVGVVVLFITLERIDKVK